ncbi:hypothetical protein RHGRI_031819 [Rhododendron griersonianum]|uniref:Uncharacterized protein n=1 Tax=Rhododendron griersonianum TaxID=479676 RepID=A0AAV6I982_9ERIC|nr:hypothetical protein RHGRI_031819 [Rhododendron griersonianum]
MANDQNDATVTEVAVIGAATAVIATGVAILDILRYRNRTLIPDIPRAPHVNRDRERESYINSILYASTKHCIGAILKLYPELIRLPGVSTPSEIRNNRRFYPWFSAHPTHEKYLNKKIEMYDEIALVVNKDRAKGNFAKSFNDVDLEARPDIEPINSDDDIAIEDFSKDKNAGKQSASSSETSAQQRRHRKRGRDTHDEESDIKTISEKLGQVADAITITRLTWDRLNVQALHDELLKMEGFDEAFLGSAFDYLVEHERLGKAFMAKSINLRKIWLEDFSSHKF